MLIAGEHVCESVYLETSIAMSSYSLIIFALTWRFFAESVYVSNLDVACLKCICTASTGCDENYECSPQGFCGPFFISRKYWEEGDRVTLSSDPRYKEDGHEECAKNFQCASKIVANYMAKNGRDCNGDGITDCDDFARIHFYGEARCDNAIENTSYHDRYVTCRPPKAAEDFALLRRKRSGSDTEKEKR